MSNVKHNDNLKDYNIGAEIGRGSFATVHKGEYLPTGKPVALKVVSTGKLTKKLLENLELEISILKTMKHPHIVALLDSRRTSTHFYLAMEYCSLGDLSYFIRNKDKISNSLPLVNSLFERYPSDHGLHEDLARHFLKQLASALQFLREQNLVHRDIKPQNLLLLPPKKTQQEAIEAGYSGQWELPILKLADFGFARSLPNTSLAETLCGSPLYMAPEILRYEKYNAKADLWSVGAVVYEMVVGKPPFQAANHVDLLKNIENAADKIHFPSNNRSSQEIRKLIRSLLKKSPTERVGFNEFFNNPILREDIMAESRPLDQSKLDEKIFISEYIQGVPTTNQLPTPPSRSVSGSPEVVEKVEVDPSPGSSLLVSKNNNNEKNTNSTTNTIHSNVNDIQPHTTTTTNKAYSRTNSRNTSPNPSPHPSLSTRQVAIPINRSNPDSLEQEYVVVEKRTVEVNYLADELASSPNRTKVSGSPAKAIMANTRDRRMSIGYGTSPTNALSKALNMASARLFGTKVDSYGTTTFVSPPQFAQRPIPNSIESEERLLIKELEVLATKAKVVNLFAEVKYAQLMPIDADRIMNSVIDDDVFVNQQTCLNPEVKLVVAEEALVLYVKTLSLLTKAMNRASRWWNDTSKNGASLQLNDIVQWIREKFNESLEKAEYAQLQIESCYSYNNRRIQDRPLSITAERLIFDRALEMSRAAAVNEQLGDDLEGCESSYGTAIWMLEALLVTDKQEEVLNDDDRAIVEKFITSISHRLADIRNKLEGGKVGGYAQTPSLPIHIRRRTSSSSSTSSSPSRNPLRSDQISEISS